MSGRRALHYVFKIGNRRASMDFYTKILGMKVLRHEEFDSGCEATCNGPYAGAWSKTMIGYGSEDDNFVIELTYNYGISSYKKGNEFQGLTLQSSDVMARIRESNYPCTEGVRYHTLVSPCGYHFNIEENPDMLRTEVSEFILSTSNLKVSENYWNKLLSMEIYDSSNENEIILGYGHDQTKLKLRQISEPIDRGLASGRIAFSCPTSELKEIEKQMEDNKQTILTPYLGLPTPGKATAYVVILADPDGHEICFVGVEAFLELAKVDPGATELLENAMKNDKSEIKLHGTDKK